MISVSELRDKSMTLEKKRNAKNDIFAFYVGRPISYYFTIPFLCLGVRPNTVSFLSLFPALVGALLCFMQSIPYHAVIGCFLFFLWNIMDGVDGNIARYTGNTSKTGALWDAASGYVAMVCMYVSAGIVGFQETGNYLYITMGDASAVSALLARLLMHKRINLCGSAETDLNQKEHYGILRIVAMNIVSYAGLLQVFLFLAAVFHTMWLFTVLYCVINAIILVLTMYTLLRAE